MSQFDRTTLENLKKLCRIDINENEEADILRSLSRVLNYVSQLNEVPTEGVEPCNYVLRSMLTNQMREDIVQEVLPREIFLANTPDQIGGMVRTPPILKDI